MIRVKQTMRNFHLPLTDEQHAGLRAASRRARRPATALARQAITDWLDRQRRTERDRQIAEFASKSAGTELDLDPALESASIEHLNDSDGGGW